MYEIMMLHLDQAFSSLSLDLSFMDRHRKLLHLWQKAFSVELALTNQEPHNIPIPRPAMHDRSTKLAPSFVSIEIALQCM